MCRVDGSISDFVTKTGTTHQLGNVFVQSVLYARQTEQTVAVTEIIGLILASYGYVRAME